MYNVPFLLDNTCRKMQLLPGATQVAGVVDDSVVILIVHGHLDVVGVGPEIIDILTAQNSREYDRGS